MIDLLKYSAQLAHCPKCGGRGNIQTKTGNQLGGGFAQPGYRDKTFCRVICLACINNHTPWRFFNDENTAKSVQLWLQKDPAPNGNRITQTNKGPLIVNYGMGVDSTAMLIAMVRQGMVPDLIITANTGGEKPETYAYLDYFEQWLVSKGFPRITRVQINPPKSPYNTLEGYALYTKHLPSLAYHRKSCSLKFKAEVMDAFIGGRKGSWRQDGRRIRYEGWKPAQQAWAEGGKPTKFIGYDNGPKDSRRAVNNIEDKLFHYEYPLRQLGWDREQCILEILREGLIVPIKSACYFCPASKEWELLWLAATHPDQFLRAIQLEDNAVRGGKLKKFKGLWSDRSWRLWAEELGLLQGDRIVMEHERILTLAKAAAPDMENNFAIGCSGLVAAQHNEAWSDGQIEDYYQAAQGSLF